MKTDARSSRQKSYLSTSPPFHSRKDSKHTQDMSAESIPIMPSAFAEAIKELPLSTVYAKASELRNSISHLRRSNDELWSFISDACDAEEDRRELEGYIVENEGVITSMTERIQLLKTEVENRGQIWIEEDVRTEGVNGAVREDQAEAPVANGASGDGTIDGNIPRSNSTAEETREPNEEREEDGIFL